MADDLIAADIVDRAKALFAELGSLPDDDRIDVINELRLALAEHSPMRAEPVDCVLWVRSGQVEGNAYNPNVVAAPEMRLLKRSILDDGFTQPIVAWPTTDWGPADGEFEVVDGFHRHRVGKDTPAIRKRTRGRLPVAVIRPERHGKDERMAATIRHNRARGVHTVDKMSDMVLELIRRGKTREWIGAEFGMEPDEVLRLAQVKGLAEMFADTEFSEAWEAAYDPEANAEGARVIADLTAAIPAQTDDDGTDPGGDVGGAAETPEQE